MNTMKKTAALLMCAILCFSLAGCGRKAAEYRDDYAYYSPGYQGGKDAYEDGYAYAPNASESAADVTHKAELYGLKMTYSATIELETTDAQKSETELMKAIAACGGYISSQESYGGYTSARGNYVTRDSRITVKVPADKLDSFISGMDGIANVTSVSRSAEDITSAYLDTEARLSSLQAQKGRLEELMGEAGSLTELLEVEDRLTQVIYEIESYTARMNGYKDLVAFSTVTVNLREVSVITAHPENFFQRIGSAFRNGWSGFAENLGNIAVGIVGALPYLLLLAAVAVFIVLKIRKHRRSAHRSE